MTVDFDQWTVRRLKQETDAYGAPDTRRRGRILVTRALFMDSVVNGRFPLPRMTRIVDFYASETGDDGKPLYFTLVVESPDIPPPSEDGTLPLLDLDARMHALSKDRAAPLLNIVEYVATVRWRDSPETVAVTSMLGWDLTRTATGRVAMLAEALNAGPLENSKAYDIANRLNVDKPFDSWTGFAAQLPDADVRELAATMMEAFWGRCPLSPKAA